MNVLSFTTISNVLGLFTIIYGLWYPKPLHLNRLYVCRLKVPLLSIRLFLEVCRRIRRRSNKRLITVPYVCQFEGFTPFLFVSSEFELLKVCNIEVEGSYLSKVSKRFCKFVSHPRGLTSF